MLLADFMTWPVCFAALGFAILMGEDCNTFCGGGGGGGGGHFDGRD